MWSQKILLLVFLFAIFFYCRSFSPSWPLALLIFSLICKMLAKFSGVESERTIFKFTERLRNFLCCVYLNPTKQESEIRKFHVAVVKRWLRIVQKSVMHVQSWCFAYINLLLFNWSPSLSSLLLWSRNFATMVTWRRTCVTRRPFCLRRFNKLCLSTASLVLTKLSSLASQDAIGPCDFPPKNP